MISESYSQSESTGVDLLFASPDERIGYPLKDARNTAKFLGPLVRRPQDVTTLRLGASTVVVELHKI